MCGLFGSRSPETLARLLKLNSRRGQKSLSQSRFTVEDGVTRWTSCHRSEKIELQHTHPWTAFTVVHIQAPTSTGAGIHPASYGEDDTNTSEALWHNGILKEGTITQIQDALNTTETWDTMLMVRGMGYHTNVGEFLSKLDGSFACVYHSINQLYLFRNALSPLFVDDNLSFSSVPFGGSSKPLPPNTIWRMDFESNALVDTGIHFITLNNPYNF